VFKPYVDRMLRELTEGLDAVAQFVSPQTGTVAIAFQQSLVSWLIPDLVRSFRAPHPDVGFQLTQVGDELRGLPLNGGTTDLELGTRRFRVGKEATRPGDLAVWTRRIGGEPLRLALPRDHEFADRHRIRLGEVADAPFIAMRQTSDLRKLGDDLCMAAGFRPKIVFEGDDLTNVRGLVAAGLGVAIVPAPRAGTPVAAPGPVVYRELLDNGAERDIYLTWPADRSLLPAAELFRKHVVRTVSAGRIRPVSDGGG
jgi:DNA-binding transcriptional LysR family regulator